MNFNKVFSLVLLSLYWLPASGLAGFVSSNGMSLPLGLICDMGTIDGKPQQLQLKLDEQTGFHIARIVEKSDDDTLNIIQILSEPVACQATQYADEPTIENNCMSFTLDGKNQPSSKVQSIPHRGSLHIVIKSPYVSGGSMWKKFSEEKCMVMLNSDILPL